MLYYVNTLLGKPYTVLTKKRILELDFNVGLVTGMFNAVCSCVFSITDCAGL